MSFLDKIAATLAPAASEEDMREARMKAEQLGAQEPWLGMIVDQHKQIEAHLEEAMHGADAGARRSALKQFMLVLTGHSTAEEAVVYPDIAVESSKAHAGMAYEEHAMTKIQVAELEKLDPMSQEWRDKAEHIRSALQQHVYQEEDSWYPQLADKLSPAEKQRMTARFTEEYERYMGSDAMSSGLTGGMSSAQRMM